MGPAVKRRLAAASVLAIAMAGSPAQAPTAAVGGRQTALALEQRGQWIEAEAAWRAFLQTHPGSADACAHLGLLEARQQHYGAAVPFYRKALALDPAMPGLRLDLGLSLFKSGQLKAAIDAFSPLLKAQPPSSPEALRLSTLIGMAHYGLGEYAAAVPYLRKVTENDPKNLPYRLLLAQSCMWSKQYQCVLDTYHQILELNAESAEADMLAGEAMDEMKNQAGATQEFRAAVKANPKEPYAHFGLGYMLWTQNQLAGAAQEFKDELANVPDEADAMTFLADCDMQMNDPAEALPLLEDAVRTDPGLERAHLDLGILYAHSGHREEAVRELTLAARLSPNDTHVYWQLGRLYLAMGKRDEAKAEFAKTKSLNDTTQNTEIFNELHVAQGRGKPNSNGTGPLLNK
ncbi:MAG: tetratricopeptide repeat protein [Terracidiphilus sp.]